MGEKIALLDRDRAVLRNVSKRCQRAFVVLGHITDPGSFYRAFHFLYLSDLGRLLGAFNPDPRREQRSYHRSTVLRFNRGDLKPNANLRAAYAALANAILDERTQGRVRVVLIEQRCDHTWRLIPRTDCARCRREFVPERLDASLCPKCRKARARR